LNIEVKTACGEVRFQKQAALIIYAPCTWSGNIADILDNAYIFSKNGFMNFLENYDGNLVRSDNNHIQSFHWIDSTGKEYRPKASRKIERYFMEQFAVMPTIRDIFDILNIDITDEQFATEYAIAFDRVTAQNNRDDGRAGRALEQALKAILTPRSKYRACTTPQRFFYGDLRVSVKQRFAVESLQELLDIIGIE